jgi:hypothetical protein
MSQNEPLTPEQVLAELDATRARISAIPDAGDAWLKEHDGEWCCCWCGPSKTSRGEWCDRGCGSDYNAMIRIDHWRMGRLFRIVVAALSASGENGGKT